MTTDKKNNPVPLNSESRKNEQPAPVEKSSLNSQWLKEIWQQKAFDDDSLLSCLVLRSWPAFMGGRHLLSP